MVTSRERDRAAKRILRDAANALRAIPHPKHTTAMPPANCPACNFSAAVSRACSNLDEARMEFPR